MKPFFIGRSHNDEGRWPPFVSRAFLHGRRVVGVLTASPGVSGVRPSCAKSRTRCRQLAGYLVGRYSRAAAGSIAVMGRDAGGLIASLKHGLIMSCQPVPGSAFDTVESIVAYGRIGQAAGARALRIEGVANVRAVAAGVALPVIGLVKRDLESTPLRITPLMDDVAVLAAAGASVIAFDATDRARPVPVPAMVAAIHARGCLAMADIATEAEAHAASKAGADLVGTTLSGHVGGTVPELPDLALVRRLGQLPCPVIAEGRYNTAALAAEALRAGAHAVVVGSAITRPEFVARWFVEALEAVRLD